MIRSLAFATLAGLALMPAPARADFFVQFADETTGGSGLYRFDYALAGGRNFTAGETLTVLNVDPNATVTSNFPTFFGIAETGTNVVLTALVDGRAGTLPAFSITSRNALGLMTEAIDGGPGSTGFVEDTYAPGPFIANPVPEPASLALVAVGLALAAARARVKAMGGRGENSGDDCAAGEKHPVPATPRSAAKPGGDRGGGQPRAAA